MTSQDVTIHGEPDVADYPPGATFGPRTNWNYELVWLLAGSVRWIWHDTGDERTIEPGQLLLTRPGMRDEFRWDVSRPSRHGYVHFTLNGPAAHIDSAPLTHTTTAPSPLAGLLEYLLWLPTTRSAGWDQRVTDVVGLIARSFADGPLPDEPANATEPPLVAAALDYVRNEWRQTMRPIPLAELASATGCSSAHLARTFRQHLGVGVVTLLEMVRLTRAEHLLTRSNLAINQISRACGFVDPLHFSKRFKAAYGASPRAHRKATEPAASPLAAAALLPMAQRLSG